MTRLLLLIMGLVLGVPTMAQDEIVSYAISGTVPTGVTSVYLQTVRNEPIDTALVYNGRFQFKGALQQNAFVALTDNGTDLPVNLIIDGTPVEVNMERSVLKGSKLNERLNKADRQITDLTIDYMQNQMDYAQVGVSQVELRDSLRRVMTASYNKVVVEMKI